MVGVLAVGFLANLMIKPVAEAHSTTTHTRTTRTASRPARRPSDQHRRHHPRTTSPALVALAWLLVGIPLAYGLWQTLVKASALFSG